MVDHGQHVGEGPDRAGLEPPPKSYGIIHTATKKAIYSGLYCAFFRTVLILEGKILIVTLKPEPRIRREGKRKKKAKREREKRGGKGKRKRERENEREK
jgi:hypothetical protein